MRLFIAHRIPEDLAEAVVSRIKRIRGECADATWTKAHAYHITFAFLGEQSEGILAALQTELASRLTGIHPVEAAIEGLGFFPSERRPRVGWLSVEPAEAISQIATRVREALTTAGITFDEKPFHPHLTLVRPKAIWGARDITKLRAALEGHERWQSVIESVSIYQSALSAQGATHTELRRIPFTAQVGGQ